MASPSANLNTLPTELLLHIVGFVKRTSDILSMYRSTRRFNDILLPTIFTRYLTRAANTWSEGNIERALFEIFLWSVMGNEVNLIRQLTTYHDLIDLKGYMMQSYFIEKKQLTFLHFAILMDAPNVANHLMKHGADLIQEDSDYPDLSSLSLALVCHQVSSQQELGAALRTACNYALPRTVRFLLARGADANAANKYGYTPIHTALSQRQRWSQFSQLHTFTYPVSPSVKHPKVWERLISETVVALRAYGADVQSRIATSRLHKCDYKCWKSISCENRGQTPLHLAAASGLTGAARVVLQGPEHLDLADDGGCTPLHYAMVHGHSKMIKSLLQYSRKKNPIINKVLKSTALHVACRFGLSSIVSRILEQGADVNAVDARGLTPLHEVLSQILLERETEALATLQTLAHFGADPEMRTVHVQTPRQIGMKHPWGTVREMFTRFTWNACRDSFYVDLLHTTGSLVPDESTLGAESVTKMAPKKLPRPAEHSGLLTDQEMPGRESDLTPAHQKTSKARKPKADQKSVRPTESPAAKSDTGKKTSASGPVETQAGGLQANEGRALPKPTSKQPAPKQDASVNNSPMPPSATDKGATEPNARASHVTAQPESEVRHEPAKAQDTQAQPELPLAAKHRKHIFTIWEAERLAWERSKKTGTTGPVASPAEAERPAPETAPADDGLAADKASAPTSERSPEPQPEAKPIPLWEQEILRNWSHLLRQPSPAWEAQRARPRLTTMSAVQYFEAGLAAAPGLTRVQLLRALVAQLLSRGG